MNNIQRARNIVTCPVESKLQFATHNFALRKPDAPSGFRRYATKRVGLYSCEFRKAWDSRAVGRRFHSEAQGKRSSPAAVLHPGEQDARWFVLQLKRGHAYCSGTSTSSAFLGRVNHHT